MSQQCTQHPAEFQSSLKQVNGWMAAYAKSLKDVQMSGNERRTGLHGALGSYLGRWMPTPPSSAAQAPKVQARHPNDCPTSESTPTWSGGQADALHAACNSTACCACQVVTLTSKNVSAVFETKLRKSSTIGTISQSNAWTCCTTCCV